MVYIDSNKNNRFFREFSELTKSEDLKWHTDEFDREIYSLSETDWKIQLDNELPILLNSKINIPANTWHRLIKGTGKLNLEIKETR